MKYVHVHLDDAFDDIYKFRLKFYCNTKLQEYKWVIFPSHSRGAVGKLIFTVQASSAYIKVVEINASIRKRGLSTILFRACISTLQQLGIEQVTLNAEEDTTRFNRLVNLYEHWGFHMIAPDKIQILTHEDGSYRKIPMILQLQSEKETLYRPIDTSQWFTMLSLNTGNGEYITCTNTGQVLITKNRPLQSHWQILFGEGKKITLRSFYGQFLCAELNGSIVANRHVPSTWETFQIVSDYHGMQIQTYHGNFLTIDHEKHVPATSTAPSIIPWGTDQEELVYDQIDEKLFHRIMRKIQTKTFVDAMKQKYAFDNPAKRFRIDDVFTILIENTEQHSNLLDSILLNKILTTAMKIKEDGHPDWMQLVGFLYCLGMLIFPWADENGPDTWFSAISPAQWFNEGESWIVDTVISSFVKYPELNLVNTDHVKYSKNSKAVKSCGLHHYDMIWSPDEYLYQVLIHNDTSLPSEALYMIRYRSFKSWWNDNDYFEYCTPEDKEQIEWVHSFNQYDYHEESTNRNIVDEMRYFTDLSSKYLPLEIQF